MKKVIVLGLAMLFVQAVAVAGSPVLPNEDSVIGTVDGKDVTLGEIQTRDIHELRKRLFKEIENAFISEAINRLKTTDKGFADIALPEMKESEVRKFYDDNSLAQRGSYEQLAPQIRQYLTQMMQARVEYNLYKIAGEKGKVSSGMVSPGDFVVTAPVGSAFIHGAADGSVMVLEFSDFQCPFCKKVRPTIRNLVKQYGDRVAFGYRHLPLSSHREADESAVATECAREQGKFLQMHGRLYQQQSNQSVAELKKLAREIGVADLDKFNSCLDEDRYRAQVNQDMEVAASLGISGTPAFVVGRYDSAKGVVEGEILSGAQPLDIFAKTLQKYLPNGGK
ncbi:MAG: thioredoxin domain-containing protein [Gammaproteobacteria bacterium]|nr:thioredoxin domain-containing protein [Gammaproteobacteria bacterium]